MRQGRTPRRAPMAGRPGLAEPGDRPGFAGTGEAAVPCAANPLYAAIAPLLADLPAGTVPGLAWLNAARATQAPGAVSGAGQPIRFVTADDAVDPDYEAGVYATGRVPTRAANWHDAFNALAWCVWPASKAACNSRHLAEGATRRAAGLRGRGPCRDALTQFDECGVVVSSSDAEILDLLSMHAWRAVFVERRARLLATTRFFVFGHGSWDQLRAPFAGLCGKAVYRRVDAAWLQWPLARQQSEADAWLAGTWLAPGGAPCPTPLAALPLLGIPGVTPANEAPAYYDDVQQFRPLPAGRASAPVWA